MVHFPNNPGRNSYFHISARPPNNIAALEFPKCFRSQLWGFWGFANDVIAGTTGDTSLLILAYFKSFSTSLYILIMCLQPNVFVSARGVSENLLNTLSVHEYNELESHCLI